MRSARPTKCLPVKAAAMEHACGPVTMLQAFRLDWQQIHLGAGRSIHGFLRVRQLPKRLTLPKSDADSTVYLYSISFSKRLVCIAHLHCTSALHITYAELLFGYFCFLNALF
jgi:hypothetical protein